jgi:drug/metabolite transporter (DMT)-like permease
MLLIGIITGLGMAFFQSCSYLGSRFFYAKTGRGGLHLLAVSHVLMGLASGILLWIFWPAQTIPFAALAWTVIINTIAYMAGQAFFLQALKHANPSQISSLLALKLIGISLASLFILNIPITPFEVLGIVLCLGAVLLLNSSRDKIPLPGLVYCLLALFGYSASDICIAIIVKDLEHSGITNPSLIGTCVVYICTGLIGAIMLPFLKDALKKPGLWLSSLPFAAAWLIAINLLFHTFLLLGPVFGNILQTTRGIFSVLLGNMVSKLGYSELENIMPAHAFLRRLASALLMTVAVSLFVIK